MWQAKLQENHGKVSKFYQLPPDQKLCIYFKSEVINKLEEKSKKDPLEFLILHGCFHLALKILKYLDASSLFAASLVCVHWQSFILDQFYTCSKFRSKSWNKIVSSSCDPQFSNAHFQLKKPKSKIIDVTIDDNYNLLTLAIISGSPHVMSFSLFTKGRLQWIHRFREYFEPLTCISSGNSLVALGSKFGQIYVYESVQESKCVHLTAILAHHTSLIYKIIFHKDSIISCSDDMTIGLVTILHDGALVLSKILNGHVSRVKCLYAQLDKLISGSDDRTVKLWNLNSCKNSAVPIYTFSGHSGPINAVLLHGNIALSSSGSCVRIWSVENGTCLKLLQHESQPIVDISLIMTYKIIATIDANNVLRIFSLSDLESEGNEILVPLHSRSLTGSGTVAAMQSIPNQLFVVSVQNKIESYPFVQIKFLDYV